MLERLPKYLMCVECKNSLNQGCIEQCMPKDDYSWFELKPGTNLEDMPAFPLKEYKTKMSNDVRKVVLGEYVAKIVDHLQGRYHERQYFNHPRSSRIPEDIKGKDISIGSKERDTIYQDK